MVPTAIRHPDHPAGVVCDTPIEITDLTATILECAGDWVSIVGPRYMYVKHAAASIEEYGHEELFDLEADPAQTCNLLIGRADEQHRLDPVGAAAADLTEPIATLPQELHHFLLFARERVATIKEATPPAQTRWAPLPPRGEAFSYGR